VSVETVERRRSSSAQWAVVVLTVLVSVALAVVLPRIAERSKPKGEALASGTPVEYGGVAIVPAEGWTKTDNPAALILEKQGIKLLVFPPTSDATSASDSVTSALKAWTEDPSSKAEVGQVTTLTTDGGLDAAYAAVTDAGEVNVVCAFSDGSNLATANISLPASQWGDVQQEIAAMVKSVSFTGEAPS
jgi:hypothetical protein